MRKANRNARSTASLSGSKEAIDPVRAKHLNLARHTIMTEDGPTTVTMNDSESPLAWLARRKGRDGRTMISGNQFVAGEKLRADFTRGHLTPRVTSSWSETGGSRSMGFGGAGEMTDMIIASRQRVRSALEACGPELSGLLLDVCCFLRGLEDIERERKWPSRSAKIVLQLALDRLARHYGLVNNADHAHVRTWLASDAVFSP